MAAAQSSGRRLILDIALAVVKVRPTPSRHEAYRRDTPRLILSLLPEVGEALSRLVITQRVMQARRLTVADRALCQTMRDRVGTSPRGVRERGSAVALALIGLTQRVFQTTFHFKIDD